VRWRRQQQQRGTKRVMIAGDADVFWCSGEIKRKKNVNSKRGENAREKRMESGGV